ncbi:MAG: AAA family ATPase [Candidatus Nitrosocaldaceae archaeon]|nr:MAG: AAA family ATPase [Candidatus Nitrosocaldaceae archaeon]
MKSRTESIQLRVMEAKQRDVGKKRARINESVMEALKITTGDIIEIIGKKRTAVTVWPADDEEDDEIIRIDGQTRKNAGVSINELVTIRAVEAKTARSATLLSLNKISIDKEFTEFVKTRLKNIPMVEGDEVSVIILGNYLDFKLFKSSPKNVIKIDKNTKLTILTDTSSDRKPRVTYEEIGGLKEQILKMRETVELPLKHPEVFQRLGIEPHTGILLYGPPGCGKTLIAKAIASETDASFYSINGPEIMNKYYGETEAKLRDIFKEARENAPSIIFIDEIDAIAPKREEAFGDVEKRVVAQLLALMDGLSDRGNVIVIGATNRPESVDPALRRPGRFDREIEINVPNIDGRLEILQIHTRGMPLADDVDLRKIANELHGYTGADIRALCREAAMKALRRYLPEIYLDNENISPELLERMIITNSDFYEAMKEIIPTAMREFYVETPKITYKDVGGMNNIKKTLKDNIITALNKPEKFEKMGITPPKGALLYGPPGCGKTMLAIATAKESNANTIIVKGPEILSKWVGESERAIRDIFRKAKNSSPCIIIFDELDSLARARSIDSEDSGASERVLSQLLTEMDSISSKVVVIGITNRPDLIDTSLLRPGRLDLILYVQPPEESDRLEILKILTKKMPLGKDVELGELARITKGYTGADLSGLCREAVINAINRNSKKISMNDFQEALKRTKASVTDEVNAWYASMSKNVTYAIPKPIDKAFYG